MSARMGPKARSPFRARLIYWLTLLGNLVWLAAIVFAPYLRSRGLRLNSLIYAVFAPTCHQIPSRCFHLWGFPMAVCGRCTGIYAGFLAGMLVLPAFGWVGRKTPPRSVLFLVLSGPIGIDALGNFFGLWSTSIGLRFATGVVWGSILPFYLLAGLDSLFLKSAATGPKQTLE
jgi:uncharacterized membrane protein